MSPSRVVLALLLPCALACASEEERAERARQQAQEALVRGDLPAVREALGELRESRPDTPESLLELTSLMSRAGEAPQAIWLLEAAIPRFPEHDDLRTQLGAIALITGNPVLARTAMERIGPDSPQHLDALLLRSRAELELGDLEKSLDILEQAEALHPDDPRAMGARIGTLLRERRFDDAAQAIEAAKAAGADAETARRLEWIASRIELAQGDVEAAIRRLRALHEQAPDDVIGLQALVHALFQTRRSEEALAIVSAAIESDPEHPALPPLLAQVHLQLGNLEEAERAIRRHIGLSETPSAYVVLAQFHEQLDDRERAAQVFEESVARFPDEPMLRMYLAESLAALGRLDDARARFAEFRGLAPGDPHVDYLRGRLAFEEGDLAEAEERLRSVLPRLDRAYTQFWLGRTLEERGDPEGAARRYGLALQRDPLHAAGVIALMRLAEQRGDWEAIGQHALQLVRRAPSRNEAYTTGITALVRTGNAEAAEQLARQLRARLGEDPRSAALLSFALRAQGRLDEAARVLAGAEESHGPDPELDAERALLHAARGETAEAIAGLRRAIEARPGEARYHASLAALHFSRRESEAGVRATDRALELAPHDPDPLALRARYHAATGQPVRAIADCERYLRVRPRDAELHFVRGALLQERGRADEAIRAYRRAIELDEHSFAARNNLALLLEERGDLTGAIAVAQEAYALAESDPNVIDTLGWLYLRNDLPERSIALLEKAHRSAPELAAAKLHLALAYRKTGRESEARRLLSELVAREGATSEIGSQAHAALESLAD